MLWEGHIAASGHKSPPRWPGKKQLPALQWSGNAALLLRDWEAKHKAVAYSPSGEQCNHSRSETPACKPREVNEWMNWDKAHTSANAQEEKNNATSAINASVCNSTVCWVPLYALHTYQFLEWSLKLNQVGTISNCILKMRQLNDRKVQVIGRRNLT